jgi:hypothetical protein
MRVNRVCEFAHALCIGDTLYFYTISGYNHLDVQVQTYPWLHAGFSIAACIVACGECNHTDISHFSFVGAFFLIPTH